MHRCLISILAVLVSSYALATEHHRGWFFLRWTESAPRESTSSEAGAESVRFQRVLSFEKNPGAKAFNKALGMLQEGDVIAYRMSIGDANKQIAQGHLSKIGYSALTYGHLAIVAELKPGDQRLLSSQSFKGPNTKDSIQTLCEHSWDAYRLTPNRINKQRLHEFVRLACEKSGKWYGYDFSGMFGLWNSNLQPASPDRIGHDYICSTVVVAALYYSGIQLEVSDRSGILDLVSPKQVISSKGTVTPTGNVKLTVVSRPQKKTAVIW